MKTLILNTFSTFSTFPMFNPAYLKGYLQRDGIECQHMDINQIVWNKLLSKPFLQSLVFNKQRILETPFPYSIIYSEADFADTKERVINRIEYAINILREKDNLNIRNLQFAQAIIFRALNLIYASFGTFFMTNIPFWAKIGYDCRDVKKIYSIALDRKRNPLVSIIEEIIIDQIIPISPPIILVDILFPWDIIPALAMNLLIKKHLPKCHINYAGLGFDEFSFSRLEEHLKISNEVFFGFDSIFIHRNDSGIVELIRHIRLKNDLDNIENLYWNKDGEIRINHINKNKYFDDTVLPNYDDIDWSKYFIPERIVTDRLSYRCFWAKCSFCSINSNKTLEHSSSVEIQVHKLYKIKEKYGVSNFWFLDEACPIPFAVSVAKAIEDWGISWSLRTRLESTLTRSNMEALAKAGLKELWIGLEHVSERILSLMNKSNIIDQYQCLAKEVVHNASNIGIGLHFCHILGFPSETDEDRQQVLDFYLTLKESIGKKPFFTTFNVFGLMLGSPMISQPEKYGIIDILDSAKMFLMMKVPYKTIYGDDTDNPSIIKNLQDWSVKYLQSIVSKQSLLPLWLSIADTPYEFLLKKHYRFNPFV
ncbi:B12-binding domain-containing radical SAM protein [Porphyromonas gingivalis]|jgi:hypothetical protein|uniref:Radical SAM protein n=1 Tax=Porphyromonas gingivalis TaxID=837 RepID=A0AAE9X9K3_PORGN|nr:radical SAM protein [Porphyromonas gingivalis]WCF99639.1 radical SAM protein [Porphyromonas gingivalis]